MLEGFRTRLARRALKKWLAEHPRKRQVHTLASARTVAILFDANTEQARREVPEWAKKLEKEGKKVSLLGYFNLSKPPVETPAFDFFIRKETRFNFQPTADKALSLLKAQPDLLVCLNPAELPPLEWLAAQSQAGMKVGLATELPNDFDLLFDLPAAAGVPQFAQQLVQYGEKIVTR